MASIEDENSQICPNCGNCVPYSSKFCSKCGYKLITDNHTQEDKNSLEGENEPSGSTRLSRYGTDPMEEKREDMSIFGKIATMSSGMFWITDIAIVVILSMIIQSVWLPFVVGFILGLIRNTGEKWRKVHHVK